jgi:hypothetical protein
MPTKKEITKFSTTSITPYCRNKLFMATKQVFVTYFNKDVVQTKTLLNLNIPKIQWLFC